MTLRRGLCSRNSSPSSEPTGPIPSSASLRAEPRLVLATGWLGVEKAPRACVEEPLASGWAGAESRPSMPVGGRRATRLAGEIRSREGRECASAQATRD